MRKKAEYGHTGEREPGCTGLAQFPSGRVHGVGLLWGSADRMGPSQGPGGGGGAWSGISAPFPAQRDESRTQALGSTPPTHSGD